MRHADEEQSGRALEAIAEVDQLTGEDSSPSKTHVGSAKRTAARAQAHPLIMSGQHLERGKNQKLVGVEHHLSGGQEQALRTERVHKST